MKRIKKRVWLIGGGLLVGLALLTCVWPELFFYRSVCSVCGLEACISKINLGLWGFDSGPSWEHWSYETSPVAATLLNHPDVKTHSHAWVFAAGGGNRAMCAIGDGRHFLMAIHSSEVAAFLGELTKAGETNSTLRWRDRILNSNQSDKALGAIQTSQNDRDEGTTWLKAAEDEFLRSQTPRLQPTQ